MYLFSNPIGDQPSEPCRSKVTDVGDKYPGDRGRPSCKIEGGNVSQPEQVQHVKPEQEKERDDDHARPAYRLHGLLVEPRCLPELVAAVRVDRSNSFRR